MAIKVDIQFGQLFEIEMDGWCYGLQKYEGEIFPGLVHSIIRELVPSFHAAIRHNYAFNILELAQKVSKSAKYLISEKEVCFAIIAFFPNPADLNEEQQFTMAQIIDQVEQQYGGALQRLQAKWQRESTRKKNSSPRPPSPQSGSGGQEAA